MNTISLEEIERLKPCASQMKRVRATWPTGVPLTKQAVRQALVLGLDLEWFGRRFLKGPSLAEFRCIRDQAWDKFSQIDGVALNKHKCTCDTALDKYYRVRAKCNRVRNAKHDLIRDQAWGKYERAYAEFGRARDLALAKLKRVTGGALLRGLIGGQS